MFLWLKASLICVLIELRTYLALLGGGREKETKRGLLRPFNVTSRLHVLFNQTPVRTLFLSDLSKPAAADPPTAPTHI